MIHLLTKACERAAGATLKIACLTPCAERDDSEPAANRRHFLAAASAIAVLALLGTDRSSAQQQTVTIAYQPGADPAKVAQADGLYDRVTNWKVNWRRFETGTEVVAAVMSGDVQIGLVGSSVLAAATSRELAVQAILVGDLIGEAEALIVRNGSKIERPEELKGKTIAVPFVSTTHYSLLASLKHWSIDPKTVVILNLRPPEIAAAWERGDIDAAYVWEPALARIKASGKVLLSSKEVAAFGSPTFDVWIARLQFCEKYPEIVTSFVRVTGDAYATYRNDPTAWDAKSPQVAKIARITGEKPDNIPESLSGRVFPLLSEQLSPELLGGGLAKAVADTSAFLREQGKIPSVLSDYAPYISSKFVKAALAPR